MPYSYIRDPAEIYRQSFETICNEADFSKFAEGSHDIVVRLIHACGMVDIVDNLEISDGAVEAGCEALKRNRPIVCDVDMVRQGIIRRLLPPDLPVLCGVSDEETAILARQNETTRSAAAFERLSGDWAGGIAVIGNAPTALFHLLDLIEDGAEPPALIVGIPVGFVGAVESKDALVQNSHNVPYITVRGRRGGSAMAAAAVNAIAGGLGA
ncbi:precorrin-8X methylmutase [Hoeflea prorocentri]|uniref:Precorrin-8X methylmutase n=1 Tax=Hoeflea prorocentri TaxID=1922333 RepID=A0A9X3UIQ5_9HYPH|nr:precorrin-8X methylmutase [Hoeflea prorocentri]MCY6381382.1 precorrin-8X methylmutase [Hoeflea prorocentri]MDA5399182.1 precorrin-8X methylmutase [Hoeflea prorocentri]